MMDELYQQHVAEKMSRFQAILEATGYREILIGSGETKLQFQDDMAYAFKANPYFREWAPLATRADCYLQIIAGASKPRLFLLAVEDVWHTPRRRVSLLALIRLLILLNMAALKSLKNTSAASQRS